MKAGWFLLLFAGTLQAEEIEGTVWYNSKGEVAVVDGPAAEKKAPEPWLPQWVAREARRDKALRGGSPRRGRSWDGDAYAESYGAVWGWSYPVGFYRPSPCLPPPCPAPAFRGVSVIIR